VRSPHNVRSLPAADDGALEAIMKVLILCGGLGVRAFPFTEYLPKPMLPVDGSPVLVHLIKSFVAQGFRDFVLAAGHRKKVLDDYFDGKNIGADVRIVDTGEGTDTAGRIAACRDFLSERFVATYGDGLSDLRMKNVIDFHAAHGRLATVTVVPLMTQYGVLEAEPSGRVVRMVEKPVLREHWINVGFMVFEPAVFEHWSGDNLEREVLPALARKGELFMYRHDGFFKSLDSYKDQIEAEELMRNGTAPWKLDR
jgi:glucose-1-phosphate cytidylyltransferase